MSLNGSEEAHRLTLLSLLESLRKAVLSARMYRYEPNALKDAMGAVAVYQKAIERRLRALMQHRRRAGLDPRDLRRAATFSQYRDLMNQVRELRPLVEREHGKLAPLSGLDGTTNEHLIFIDMLIMSANANMNSADPKSIVYEQSPEVRAQRLAKAASLLKEAGAKIFGLSRPGERRNNWLAPYAHGPLYETGPARYLRFRETFRIAMTRLRRLTPKKAFEAKVAPVSGLGLTWQQHSNNIDAYEQQLYGRILDAQHAHKMWAHFFRLGDLFMRRSLRNYAITIQRMQWANKNYLRDRAQLHRHGVTPPPARLRVEYKAALVAYEAAIEVQNHRDNPEED